jgi:hypothetical protein
MQFHTVIKIILINVVIQRNNYFAEELELCLLTSLVMCMYVHVAYIS